mmetsp:Transcript_2098/g.4732  ORF Transcript_2098/g.4732 Transcript_2098/m.4732 type:complete len:255 (-) Transcript_2098:2078-2842(-)
MNLNFILESSVTPSKKDSVIKTISSKNSSIGAVIRFECSNISIINHLVQTRRVNETKASNPCLDACASAQEFNEGNLGCRGKTDTLDWHRKDSIILANILRSISSTLVQKVRLVDPGVSDNLVGILVFNGPLFRFGWLHLLWKIINGCIDRSDTFLGVVSVHRRLKKSKKDEVIRKLHDIAFYEGTRYWYGTFLDLLPLVSGHRFEIIGVPQDHSVRMETSTLKHVLRHWSSRVNQRYLRTLLTWLSSDYISPK